MSKIRNTLSLTIVAAAVAFSVATSPPPPPPRAEATPVELEFVVEAESTVAHCAEVVASDVEFNVQLSYQVSVETGRAIAAVGENAELVEASAGQVLGHFEQCDGDCTFSVTVQLETVDDEAVAADAIITASALIPDEGPTPTVALTVTDGACE